MQKYQSVYGLFVECLSEEHNDYMDFKNKFEKFFSDMHSMIKMHDRNDVVFHFVALPEKNKWLTFCAAHNNLYLGIYDRSTHNIQMNCKFDELKHLGRSDYMLIANRMSNMLSAEIPVTKNDTQLSRAWGRHIVKLRCMNEKTSVRNNAESIFSRSFTDNCRRACEESRTAVAVPRKSLEFQER